MIREPVVTYYRRLPADTAVFIRETVPPGVHSTMAEIRECVIGLGIGLAIIVLVLWVA